MKNRASAARKIAASRQKFVLKIFMSVCFKFWYMFCVLGKNMSHREETCLKKEISEKLFLNLVFLFLVFLSG